MKNKIISVIPLIFLISLLVGCAARTSTPEDMSTGLSQKVLEEAKTAQLTEGKEDWMMKWEKVISSAKKGGKLVVYSTTGGEMRHVVGRAFKERYGIGAEFIVGKGSEIAARVATEQRASLYIPDVYLGGAQSAITYLKPQGYLDSIELALILPEVIDPRLWWGGAFPWIDKDHLIVGFVTFANLPLAINTNLVKSGDITSYKDLLKPGWKGKLLINDVTMTGSGGAWFSSIQLIVSLEFLRDLARQEPAMIMDYRLQLDWLAQGKYLILIAPHSGTLTEFVNAGAPVKGITPVEGTYRSSGSGNLALFKRAPNPDAAKLFINWLLSKEGQKVYGQVMGYPSARLDVTPEGVDLDRVLDPKIKYVNGNSEENLLKQEEDLKISLEIFGRLKR